MFSGWNKTSTTFQLNLDAGLATKNWVMYLEEFIISTFLAFDQSHVQLSRLVHIFRKVSGPQFHSNVCTARYRETEMFWAKQAKNKIDLVSLPFRPLINCFIIHVLFLWIFPTYPRRYKEGSLSHGSSYYALITVFAVYLELCQFLVAGCLDVLKGKNGASSEVPWTAFRSVWKRKFCAERHRASSPRFQLRAISVRNYYGAYDFTSESAM